MAAKFDNLQDLGQKFNGSVCLYGKDPVLIQAVDIAEDGKTFMLLGNRGSGRKVSIKIDDPAFSYKDFNIGYANTGIAAKWWFRKPLKQWKQGLKKDQMSYQTTKDIFDPESMNFGFHKAFIQMLSNDYPPISAVQEYLANNQKLVCAFHKDFAVSYEAVHKDYIIEYHGKQIGHTTDNKLVGFKLLDEFAHLQEALQEVLQSVPR